MGLILAQGAEHTKPENLIKIINIINNQRKYVEETGNANIDALIKARRCEEKIMEEYGCYTESDHDIKVSPFDYAVEEKYDGYSYINSGGRFYSKRLSQAVGSEGMPIDKTDHIPHLANILKQVYEQTGADLHGELYHLGGISDDVTKIMGCTADEAQRRSGVALDKYGHDGLLHYMLIDIRGIHGKLLVNEPHRLRRAILKWVYEYYIKPIDPHGYIRLTDELRGDPRVEFSRIVRSGGEGIIIKREDAHYIPGKKPANNWIKGKKKVTHDVVMIGLNAGTGKNVGLFGSIQFGHIIDGKLTKCGNCSSGLSDEMRQYIYNNADAMIANHQVFEIEAIQESVKSFRNAVFKRLRDDKDWTECKPINVRIKEDLI